MEKREPWGDDTEYINGVFMPSEEKVLERAADLRWLLEQGFELVLITSVMDFDMPAISVVRRMVEKYGTLLTEKKLDLYLIKEPYYGIGQIPEDEEAGRGPAGEG